MKKSAILVAILALLVLAGCARQAAMPPAQTTATDAAVSEVSNDVSEIDSLTADLGEEDLNTLDQDLADIASLELQ
jgi:outer membrane biogenesis lipoprotein LolB